MPLDLERALLINIRGALGLSLGHRDTSAIEAKRLLRVVLYTLKREGFAISRTFAPGELMTIEARVLPS